MEIILTLHVIYIITLNSTALDGIQCPHWVDEYKFLPVGQRWCVHA